MSNAAVPLPSVLFSNRQDRELDIDELTALAVGTLVGEDVAFSELSVSFVSPEEIAELHVRFMDEEGPTDVLSFPLEETDVSEDGRRLLGDVIIAPAVAATNNPEDPEKETRLLLVHGILHLLGYDHEEDDERATMWARQEEYSGVQIS